MKYPYITCLLLFAVLAASATNAPTTDCPLYVVENDNVNCTCTPPNPGDSPTITFPANSGGNRLTLTNVQRSQNGTTYTCTVGQGEDTTSVVYTLLVAYGPTHGQVDVTGENPFVTNGSQSLTLSCQADVYPTPLYNWQSDLTATLACGSGDTCTFHPQPPSDDGKEVACTVISHPKSGPLRTARGVFSLGLQYPPTQAPVITPQPPDGHLLRSGDQLTCTVSGGKPLVSTVHFHCTDQPNVQPVPSSSTAIASRITVDSTHATERAMTCTCSATWGPGPDLYTLQSDASYLVEHAAVVKSFTLATIANTTSSTTSPTPSTTTTSTTTSTTTITEATRSTDITVTGSHNSSVSFHCTTFGRGVPDVNFTKEDNGNFNRGERGSTVNWTRSVGTVLAGVGCEDMGRYRCVARNEVGADSKTALLNVRCPPRRPPKEHFNMTKDGITFPLPAYPAPTSVIFIHLHNATHTADTTEVDDTPFQATEVGDTRFEWQCEQDQQVLYVANCKIRPVDVPEDLLGDYTAALHNVLGKAEVTFNIMMPVKRKLSSSSNTTAVVVVVVMAAILLLVKVIVIVCVLVMRRKRNSNKRIKEILPGLCCTFPPSTKAPDTNTTVDRSSDGCVNATDDDGAQSPPDEGGYATPDDPDLQQASNIPPSRCCTFPPSTKAPDTKPKVNWSSNYVNVKDDNVTQSSPGEGQYEIPEDPGLHQPSKVLPSLYVNVKDENGAQSSQGEGGYATPDNPGLQQHYYKILPSLNFPPSTKAPDTNTKVDRSSDGYVNATDDNCAQSPPDEGGYATPDDPDLQQASKAKKTGGAQPSPAGACTSPRPHHPQRTGRPHIGSPVTGRNDNDYEIPEAPMRGGAPQMAVREEGPCDVVSPGQRSTPAP